MRILALAAILSSVISAVAYADLLSEVNSRLEKVQMVRAEFIQQKRIKALTRPLRSEGTFLYFAGKGVAWNTIRPFPSQVVITPAGITQSQRNRITTSRGESNPAFARMTSLLLSLFKADQAALRRDFSLAIEGSPDAWTITLTPTDLMVSKVLATLSLRGADAVHSILMREASGDETEITFTNQVVNPQLTAEESSLFAQ